MSPTSHVDALLREKPATRIGKDGLADELQLSRFQLYRRVKAQTGVSPKKLAGKHRLDQACQLLAETTLSIAAVAAEVGVPDANYFTRFFKQRTGLSPRLWRKRFAGKTASVPARPQSAAPHREPPVPVSASSVEPDMPVHLL